MTGSIHLGEACWAIRGINFSASESRTESAEGFIPCLTTAGVQEQPAWETCRYIPGTKTRSNDQLLCEGDILVSTANSKPLVGKSCLVQQLPFACTFGAFVTVLRPKPGFEPDYLAHVLRTPSASEFFFEKSSHTTGIANLAVSDLCRLKCHCDQLKSSAGSPARWASKWRWSPAPARKQRSSVPARLFQEQFQHIRPLAVDGEHDPPPGGWRWRKLGEIARLESGHTPSRRHLEWWGGDVPWLALPDIRALDGKTAFETIERTNELGLANSAARLLPTGTVVLSRTASVGFVTVMGRPMATSQDFVNWVCGDEIEPWFLAYLLIACRDYVRELASGAIHKTIYVPTVEAFRVCLPPRTEQQRIVIEIQRARKALERAEKASQAQLASIDALPSALLRAAFTGKL